jgi:peroxiredoxin (alkyl hydroperoxide reductase subunit C)
MALLPGDLAPDFTLASVLDGQVENVTLSSLRGQYVMLLFYPVDFGYVAPTEFYALEPLLPSITDLPCSVLAVSTEHTSRQLQAQAAPRSQAGLNMLPIRLVSDPVGDVAKRYGVYKAEENVCFRSVFLLDPEGRVISVEKRDFPVGGNMVELVRQLQAAAGEEEADSESVLASVLAQTRATHM